MRIVLISDTHGLHDRVPQLPQGDILVHAGDFMNAGYDLREVVSFNRWLGEQPFAHRIVCGGNHDRLADTHPANDTDRALMPHPHHAPSDLIPQVYICHHKLLI